MTEYAIALQKSIRNCSSLTEDEKNDLCRMIRKAEPMPPDYYWGHIGSQDRRMMKCAACGRYLRMRKGKDNPEENRFCPGCGQRIDWWVIFREEQNGKTA